MVSPAADPNNLCLVHSCPFITGCGPRKPLCNTRPSRLSTDLLARLQQDVHAARRLYAAITQPAPLGMGRQRAQQLRPKPQGASEPLPAIPSRIPAKHRPFLNALQHILGERGSSMVLASARGPVSCSAEGHGAATLSVSQQC